MVFHLFDRVSVLIAAVIFRPRRSPTLRADTAVEPGLAGTLLDPVADKLLVAAALISLVHIDMISAWMAVVIIGRELAVTGLRGVALSMGAVVPASSLGKAKTVSQYVALTLLMLEKGVSPDLALFHLVARAALWIALALTVVSGADYFYRFFLHTNPKDLVRDRERWLTVLGLLAAYLIGAIPIGFLVARAAGGTDIRRAGSGNIGATNVLRTLGTGPAVLTLVGDIVKGYVAVRAARSIGPEVWAAAGGTVAAIAGNCWPIFLGFRGGKGVATGLGAFLALIPWAVGPAALLWIADRCHCPWPPWWPVSACRSARAHDIRPTRSSHGGGADHRVCHRRTSRAWRRRAAARQRPASREPSGRRGRRPARASDRTRRRGWGTALAMHLGRVGVPVAGARSDLAISCGPSARTRYLPGRAAGRRVDHADG
jgi:hypothetical protein